MKKILITGASKGIGYSTALKLAGNGHYIFAVARSNDQLERLKNEESSGEIIPVCADLSTKQGMAIVLKSIEHTSQIDILINNAGSLINRPFMETSSGDWNHMLEVNLLAPVNLIKAVKHKMHKGSHIVNIGSMGGFQGSSKFQGLSAYSTSKGALSILTECLSTEFAGEGITVNCLCLGAVKTEMLDKAFPGYTAPLNSTEMADFISDFALSAHKVMNGGILPVALNSPN